MSRKNFKVATGQAETPTSNKGKFRLPKKETKVPTGKVKDLAEKKRIKEEREKQYLNFRLNALERRCKRLKMTEEQIAAAKEELKKIIVAPNEYHILVFFKKENRAMIMEMLENNNIKTLMRSDSHFYVDGGKETLDKLREILPQGCIIHPYTKKKPSILPAISPPRKAKPSRTKAEKKTLALAAKKARKARNIEAAKNRKKGTGKTLAKIRKKSRLAAQKAKRVELPTQVHKKPSNSLKKEKTSLKKAA